jgi:RNA polymerase sigma factor (sigma-70 family)
MSAASAWPALKKTDAELLVALAAGKLEALGELFDRHEPAVCRYLIRLGLSPSDADDVVQATFLELQRAAPHFDPEQPARPWLMGVATFMVRRHRRSLARAAARFAAWAARPHQQRVQGPDELFERDEASRRLSHALESLAQKKREVFVLVTIEGLSGEEAARALGVPLNTIWTRLHHARRELRAALSEDESP